MTTPAARSEGLCLQIYPSTLVNASRMGKIGRSMQRTGLFTETQLVGVHADHLPRTETLADGVRIVRLRGNGRRGNLGRVLRVLLWQPRVFLHYRKQRVALVAAHNVWALPMCYLLSRRTGAPLIYNAHELETETISMKGLKQRAARLVEASLIRRCRLVSVVNEPIAGWYESTYGIARPTVVGNVPVVVDAEVGFRERLGIRPDEMMYVHTGHLVDGRSIPLILDAFAESPHHVVFLGEGPYGDAVREAARRHRNIHWVPPVEPDLIVAHVAEADAALCLIEYQRGLSARYSSPNKLLEALAAGVPAVCSDLVEARRLLGDHADRWVLEDPATGLAPAIAAITKDDCAEFRADWPGVRPWDDEVAELLAGVSRLLGRAEIVDTGTAAYHDDSTRHGDAARARPDAAEE